MSKSTILIPKSEPEACVGCHFLDSGAHSLYTKEVIAKKHSEGYSFFAKPNGELTQDFRAYIDSYANFLHDHLPLGGIDYYANVDVIFNPQISWKALKYLEKEHGLKPIPVIHYNTPTEWIVKHLEAGYEFLGLGGLGQEATEGKYRIWADKVFSILCPKPDFKPIVRTHGFAMTAYGLITRYPWWSVDSASWVKAGGFGMIYVPHRRDGEFTFAVKPYTICISKDSPAQMIDGKHVLTVSGEARKTMLAWLEHIGIDYGTVKDNDEGEEEADEKGAWSHHSARKAANLIFFHTLCQSIKHRPFKFKCQPPLRTFQERDAHWLAPGWRWPFHPIGWWENPEPLRLFYSGASCGISIPECVLAEHKPAIMLTYYEVYAKRGNTISRLKKHEQRVKALKKGKRHASKS